VELIETAGIVISGGERYVLTPESYY